MELFSKLIRVWFILNVLMRCVNTSLISKMTANDREAIFGTADENDVPEHELVALDYTPNCEKNVNCVEFQAFDEIISLRLREVNHLLFSRKTPIFFAEGTTQSKDVKYKRINNSAMNNALKFYEDAKKNSAIIMDEIDNKGIRFTGHIGDGFVLRVLPERLRTLWEEFFFSMSRSFLRPLSHLYSHHVFLHVVFKNTLLFRASSSIMESMVKRNGLPHYNGPSTIYPRVLVFVNYRAQYKSDKDYRFYELLVYLVCFWNAVNMKYIEFNHPKIRLHIAGVVIGNNEWSAPYLTRSIHPKSGLAFSGHALHRFRKFMEHNDPLPRAWDIAISQSDLQLCPTIECTSNSTLGVAYVGQTCNNISNHWALALVVDKRNFLGVQSAAHEIGHLFGASHDGQGTRLCSDDGFIMSPSGRFNRLQSDAWSECSKIEILKRIRSRTDLCWNNTLPFDETDEVPELLPGHFVSLDDQCKIRGFDDACLGMTNCTNLCCTSTSHGIFDMVFRDHDVGPPFTGSYCGDHMHCKYKQCVPLDRKSEKISTG